MNIIGSIYKVDIKNRLIAIKTYNKLKYFYFLKNQLQIFKRYLYVGIYINLDFNEEKTFLKNNINAYLVNYVNNIYSMSIYKKINYYDRKELNSSLSKFLSSLGNIMFLDLEMTMPPQGFHGSKFDAEICQAGYVLVDANKDEILRYSNYIRPVKNITLGSRTLKFLNLDAIDFYSKSISYKQFYDDFKEVLEIYNPAIIIFGKFDSIALNDSYKFNNVQSLSEQTRFINLSKIIKNFYNLKNEPGLFKLYEIYYGTKYIQEHNAISDSLITKEIFNAFIDDVNHKTDFYNEIRNKLN